MQYFFDLRDGDDFEPDEIGAELADEDAAKRMATQYLLALAQDAVDSGVDRLVSYEVRNTFGIDVFKISLSFGPSDTAQAYGLSGPIEPSATLH